MLFVDQMVVLVIIAATDDELREVRVRTAAGPMRRDRADVGYDHIQAVWCCPLCCCISHHLL